MLQVITPVTKRDLTTYNRFIPVRPSRPRFTSLLRPRVSGKSKNSQKFIFDGKRNNIHFPVLSDSKINFCSNINRQLLLFIYDDIINSYIDNLIYS